MGSRAQYSSLILRYHFTFFKIKASSIPSHCITNFRDLRHENAPMSLERTVLSEQFGKQSSFFGLGNLFPARKSFSWLSPWSEISRWVRSLQHSLGMSLDFYVLESIWSQTPICLSAFLRNLLAASISALYQGAQGLALSILIFKGAWRSVRSLRVKL